MVGECSQSLSFSGRDDPHPSLAELGDHLEAAHRLILPGHAPDVALRALENEAVERVGDEGPAPEAAARFAGRMASVTDRETGDRRPPGESLAPGAARVTAERCIAASAPARERS